MTQIGPIEIANALAAVISAIGGGFAAVAAFRSAKSAHDAKTSADSMAHRAALRELSNAASLVVAECISIKSLASELSSECKTAEVFSGSVGHSSIQTILKSISDLVAHSEYVSKDAELFCGGASRLKDTSLDEIDRVIIRMNEHINSTRVMRDELMRKHTLFYAMNVEERSRRQSNNK